MRQNVAQLGGRPGGAFAKDFAMRGPLALPSLMLPSLALLSLAPLSLALLTACTSPVEPEPSAEQVRQELREESCAVPAPTECPEPMPTYEDVIPLFETYCNTCHTPEDPSGPWPLETYSHIVSWRSLVRDEVLTCNMPPKEDAPLPPEERILLMEWILCGMPE